MNDGSIADVYREHPVPQRALGVKFKFAKFFPGKIGEQKLYTCIYSPANLSQNLELFAVVQLLPPFCHASNLWMLPISPPLYNPIASNPTMGTDTRCRPCWRCSRR